MKKIFILVSIILMVIFSTNGCVEDEVTVQKIVISGDTAMGVVGETITLTAIAEMSNGKTDATGISWTATPTDVATISNGIVTILKKGKVVITAKKDKVTETYIITTKDKLSITNKPTKKFFGNESIKLEITEGWDSANWSVSDSKLAYVDSNGNVTFKENVKGTVTITIKFEKYEDSVDVEVIEHTKITGVDELVVGKTANFTSNKTDAMWETSDSNIALVDQTGKVTAKAEGIVKISAEKDDSKAEKELKVLPELKITGKNMILIGKSIFLIGNRDKLTWSSEDESIATVDVNGKVTGIKKGTVRIIARYKTDSSGIDIEVQEFLEVNGPDSVKVNETISLTANKDDVVWESKDKSIATIDADGKVTGQKEGTVVITAKLGNETIEKEIKVILLLSIEGPAQLKVGETAEIKANKTGVTFESSDDKIATVTSKGIVIGKSIGTVIITVKKGDESKNLEIKIFEELKITGDTKVVIGSTISLTANKANVEWTSENEAIATVDANGEVTGVKKGMTDIIAKVGNETEKLTIFVVEKLMITGNNSVIVDEKINLMANKTVETWKSSDIKIATVSEDGEVLGKSEGKVTITAIIGSEEAEIEINVKAKLTITGEATVEIGNTIQLSSNYEGATWSSENDDIATVTETGEVKGIAEGKVKISIVVSGKEATLEITVTKPETKIEITGPTQVKVGETGQLSVEGEGATWSSSDEEIATIDETGIVTGVKIGKVNITVKLGENETTIEIEIVDEIEKELVKLETDAPNMIDKSTNQIITLYAVYNDGTKEKIVEGVTFKSTNIKIAKGKISKGEIKLYASYQNGDATVTFIYEEIELNHEVKNVPAFTFTGETEVIYEGTIQMEANREGVLWESSDPEIASIDENGLITTYKPTETGKVVTISGTYGDKTKTMQIKVLPLTITGPLGEIDEVEVIYSEEIQLTANKEDVVWSIKEDYIATVDETGKVSGIIEGFTRVVVTRGDFTDQILVKVLPLTITGDNKVIFEETGLLIANKEGVTWSSSDETYLTIDKDGNMKGIKPSNGKAITITAILGEKTAKFNVVVDGLVVEGDSRVEVEKTITLYANKDGVVWSSEDEDIATIDEDGKVKGIAIGKTKVTATLGDLVYSKEIEVAEAAGPVMVHYHRYKGDYSGWGMHLWNVNPKDGAMDTSGIEWLTPYKYDGEDDFGVYFELKVRDLTKGLNYIIHKGDTKDPGPDMRFPITGASEFWLIQGDPTIYEEEPVLSLQFKVGQSYINSTTEIVGVLTEDATDEDVTKDMITIEDNEGIKAEIESVSVTGTNVKITLAENLSFDKFYSYSYKGKNDVLLLSAELVNKEFFYEGDDLGANYNAGAVTFKLWSPNAAKVDVYIYDKDDQNTEIGSASLVRGEKGVWSVDLTELESVSDFEGYFYQYEVTAKGETKRALDPYAKSMAAFDNTGASTNGDRIGKGAIVDLASSEDVKPIGKSPLMANNTDMVVTEIHVRDFTIGAEDVAEDKRGTYLGFMDKINHLKDLGVTHVQFLPIQNFFTVKENDKSYKDQYVSQGDINFNWGYDPHNYFTPEGWFSSDADDPYARINEFKELVKALHDNGIGVIVDVVYNHTYGSTVFENVAPGSYYRYVNGAISSASGAGPSVESRNPQVRKLIIDSMAHFVDEFGVDGFRFDLMGFLDHDTMEAIRTKLGDDIILHGEAWVFSDLDTYKNASGENAATTKINHPLNQDLGMFNDTSRDSYAGRMEEPGFIQGQYHENPKAKAGIIAGLKGFDNNGKYALIDDDNYNIFAYDPEETLQFLTIHDGFTLWDKINLSVEGTQKERAKMVKQATAMLFTSQGKVILHGGAEMGRTKPLAANDKEPGRAHSTDLVNSDPDLPITDHLHENSYSSCDYTNQYRWERLQDEVYKGIFEYNKGLIKMRRAIPGLRYVSADNVKAGLTFIGETEPDSGEVGPEKAGYSDFTDFDSFTVKFVNGIPNDKYIIVGEVYPNNIPDNPTETDIAEAENIDALYTFELDENGEGEFLFTKEILSKCVLSRWGATDDLNYKLTTVAGEWPTIPFAYTTMGNTRIKAKNIFKGDYIVHDLKIKDHVPGEVKVVGETFIAYEIDATLEDAVADGITKADYEKLIVVHNADSVPVEIDSELITDPSEWVVIMDEDDAGVDALTFVEKDPSSGETTVKILEGKVIVPANSSTVIAK